MEVMEIRIIHPYVEQINIKELIQIGSVLE